MKEPFVIDLEEIIDGNNKLYYCLMNVFLNGFLLNPECDYKLMDKKIILNYDIFNNSIITVRVISCLGNIHNIYIPITDEILDKNYVNIRSNYVK